MRRDPYGRKLRPTREDIQAMADAAAAKASARPQPIEPVPIASTLVKTKGGRPATGRDPHISLRVPNEWKEALAELRPGKRAKFLRDALKPAMETLVSRNQQRKALADFRQWNGSPPSGHSPEE